MFALLRKLENIASTREVSQTVKDRKKSLIIDIFLGLVCPVLLVPLRYIVQGHRSDVVIGMMCITPLYASVPALFLSQLPPLLLATTNAILAGTYKKYIPQIASLVDQLSLFCSNRIALVHSQTKTIQCFTTFQRHWTHKKTLHSFNVTVIY